MGPIHSFGGRQVSQLRSTHGSRNHTGAECESVLALPLPAHGAALTGCASAVSKIALDRLMMGSLRTFVITILVDVLFAGRCLPCSDLLFKEFREELLPVAVSA